ncbi:hypothetical protein GCM10023219_04740 [Stakelama sediminis]|uniref:Alpha/beta hydrolase n=1 Tax=Stakelama sediminis TaxID=463200 RepID=A0A840YUF9_9SPHN|nr:hypothetical protein [Stakelama sediminis]MBB5717189.1 hypothetical protein [Stakelama sediminis]
MIDHYDWSGGREAMLRFGPADGPVVVAALPLFEEANRTRTFMVRILRLLADRGIGSILPDLPGQGESVVPLESVTILTMQQAFAATMEHSERPAYAVGIRSGALLDTYSLLDGRWHFAPQGGATLLRELTRIKQAETGKNLSEYWYFDEDSSNNVGSSPVEIAGNRIAPDLLTDLSVKHPWDYSMSPDIPLRTVRLESDTKTADRHVAGAPLWRRSEPGDDPMLAAVLADDIADWVRSCEG